jgi:3'-5' exoribonuclease
MVNDLKIGQSVDDPFYCKEKITGVAKNGSTYISVILQDMTGAISAKIWEVTSTIGEFDAGDFVQVVGNVGSFRDEPQITITSIAKLDSSEVNIEDFCPKTPKNIDELTKKLQSYVDSISNEYLKKLLECFFKNEKFMTGFTKSSAAKTVHHAYIGGLLEHSVTVADICESLVPVYPKVNRDLLITAALCHDIGKVKELSAFPENDYTDIGQLLGHIYMGAEMIDVQARKIEGFPRTLLNELKHCILAHHGKLEYGSPQTPKLIEAQLLSIADDADAKMRRFSDALDDVTDYEWSERQDYFLGSKYRATRG